MIGRLPGGHWHLDLVVERLVSAQCPSTQVRSNWPIAGATVRVRGRADIEILTSVFTALRRSRGC
jgi:hypothetical protein